VTPQIRDAGPADVAPVTSLEVALFGSEAWTSEAMAAEFAAVGESRTVVVATIEDEVVGYAILLTAGDVADVQRIGVAAGWQRRGLGERLLEALVQRAAAAGHARMMLEVAAPNAAALGLYRDAGFVEVARRPRYYRDGADAIVMKRDLAT
jgi:ribosomal-protein-alanine N-acetyltransferase